MKESIDVKYDIGSEIIRIKFLDPSKFETPNFNLSLGKYIHLHLENNNILILNTNMHIYEKGNFITKFFSLASVQKITFEKQGSKIRFHTFAEMCCDQEIHRTFEDTPTDQFLNSITKL